ncbi:MAG: YbhN family protein [Chloroflexota bacterium]|nr:YbhN family protein [Chloroflexota bacterium]
MAVAVVAAIFVYFLPRVVDYGEVWAAVRAMTWLELLTLALLALWNQATYWLVEMSARPGLGYRQAMKITQASTAISNTLPGGAALGAGLQIAMYVSYGFARKDIALSLGLTGLWNTFVKLGMPIIALLLLAIGGNAGGALVAASMVGVLTLIGTILAFAVVLRSEQGAYGVGQRLGAILAVLARLGRRSPRGNWGATLADFRRRTVELLSLRWKQLTVTTLLSHVTLFSILLLTLRHVGVPNESVSWEEALASFAFVRLLSALPVTPGGLGVVELGLTATLVAAGGDEALVVAAVLVYRLLTFVLPIPVGAVSYFFWRHEVTRHELAGST